MEANTAATRRIVEQLYRCATTGDLQGALALTSPDVVLHEPPFLPFGGTYTGIEGFTKAYGNVLASGIDLTQLRVQRLVVEGERAFSVLHVPTAGGRPVVFAEEFVIRGGKAVEISLYYHDTAAVRLGAA